MVSIPALIICLLLACCLLSFFQNDLVLFERNPFLYRSSFLSSRPTVQKTLFSCVVAFSLVLYYELHYFKFYLKIIFPVLIFFPYLMKSSKVIYCCFNGMRTRENSDKLMTTSLIYFAGSLYAFFINNDLEYAFICLITTTGSLLYHAYRETRFFNFDNVFASVHFFVYIYTLCDSQDKFFFYFLFGAITFPIAAFAMIYCGLPADVVLPPSEVDTGKSSDPVRYSREVYDTWHTVWHLSSGCGPLLAGFYLHTYYDPESNIGGIQELPSIYLAGIGISLLINLVANYVGIVPID